MKFTENIELPVELKKVLSVTKHRGVARIFQRGAHRGYSADHHPGIADYIWFIPLLSLVYQRAQSYYRGMKALIN